MQTLEQRADYLAKRWEKLLRDKNIQEVFLDIAWHIAALEMQNDIKEELEIVDD